MPVGTFSGELPRNYPLFVPFGFLIGIPAVIVGHLGRRAVTKGAANNGSLLTVGLALGWIAVGLFLVSAVLLGIFFAAWQRFVGDVFLF